MPHRTLQIAGTQRGHSAGRALLPLLALVVVGVLAVATGGLRFQRARLLEDFGAAQLDVARRLVADLSRELDDMDDDARLVMALAGVPRAKAELAPDKHGGALQPTVDALATVVRHYRALTLFRGDQVWVSATDPTLEDAALKATLARWSAAIGARVVRNGRSVFDTDSAGARQFLIYGRPGPRGQAVVLVSEARLLLRNVLRSRAPHVTYLLVDPARAVWVGCADVATCRAHAGPSNHQAPAPGITSLLALTVAAEGRTFDADDIPAVVALPRRQAAVAWATLDRGGLRWTPVVVASAEALEARERTLLSWFAITSAAVTLALTGFGALIVVQQRRSAVLRERLLHAQEVAELQRQLVRAEKLATVGVLTAGLAHEIGTPLGIIRGRAEILLAKVKDAAIARDVESVIRQIDQIGGTIRQVLDFGRAQPVELRAVAPDLAVREAIEVLAFRLEQKELRTVVDAAPDLPAIAADPDQLQQVLVNLLINAADACAPGGTIRARVHGDGPVRLEIEDDGCGIAPEDLNAVFDPYFTTKKRGEGTGLGLPVAASIVRNHGGEIGLRSQPGVGTTVAITWPTAEASPHDHP